MYRSIECVFVQKMLYFPLFYGLVFQNNFMEPANNHAGESK